MSSALLKYVFKPMGLNGEWNFPVWWCLWVIQSAFSITPVEHRGHCLIGKLWCLFRVLSLRPLRKVLHYIHTLHMPQALLHLCVKTDNASPTTADRSYGLGYWVYLGLLGDITIIMSLNTS